MLIPLPFCLGGDKDISVLRFVNATISDGEGTLSLDPVASMVK